MLLHYWACSLLSWQLNRNHHVGSHGSCTAIIPARRWQISNTTALFCLWKRFEGRPHATVRDLGRRQGAKRPSRPTDGWGGWGYVTKHLASSFQRHMDLHKHILLCVCRLQTHCLTHSPRLSCNELEWAQMRGRNLNYWDTPPLQTYTFTLGDFCCMTCFS